MRKIRCSRTVDVSRRICPRENDVVSTLRSREVLYCFWNSNKRRKRIPGFAAAGKEQEQPDGVSHLEDISAEILILHDIGEHLLNVSCVDSDRFLFKIGTLERNLVEQLFHDRMQPAGADVFGVFIHCGGEACDLLNGIIEKRQLDAVCVEQRDV